MITPVVQRWRDRRSSYRPTGETIRTSDFDVEVIRDDSTAKRFVLAHHYSGSYPAAVLRAGLYQRGALEGVAVLSVPCSQAVLRPFGAAPAAELGRLVLLDAVPANGESWFIARVFELARREAGLEGVVSFADPVMRTNAAGGVIFGGHVGTIYQATNAIYSGRTATAWRRLLPDGTIIHERALAKIRRRDQGWRYAAARLEVHGATRLEDGEDASAWLGRWLPVLTRRLRHTGNHRYFFPLSGVARRAVRNVAALPYPKFDAPRSAA